jgi:hypothetical protein
MEFRLTYKGPLNSTQRDPTNSQPDKNAEHKHKLRKHFHKQLKRLWAVTPYLSNIDSRRLPHLRTSEGDYHDIVALSQKYARYGFNFVPLVTQAIEVLCELQVLFLRPDKPGDLIWAGDIDNRIKTLIDALRLPMENERYAERKPDADEAPFFVLLEEDKLVTKLSIETDQLLEFDSKPVNEVMLVITARVRPYKMHMGNLEFGG